MYLYGEALSEYKDKSDYDSDYGSDESLDRHG